MKEKLNSYIKEMGLKPDTKTLLKYVENFTNEMKNGLAGFESSLKMIPSYLGTGTIDKDEHTIVIDAGGTNLRVSIIKFSKNGGFGYESYERTKLPGIDREYSSAEFFDYIYNFIKDYIKEYEKIGFCFSYPMEKLPDKDGKLIKWTKEIKAKEVEGQMIGKNLTTLLEQRGHGKKKIVLLNDTVASLFGGMSNTQRNYDNFIGLIVGTGCNAAYIEDSKNITKIESNLPEQVINLESGNFNKIDLTKIDKQLNEETQYPYSQVLEKMVSGRYLGRMIYFLAKSVSDDNIINGFGGISDLLNNATTQDISEWIYYGNNCDNDFSKNLIKLNPTAEQYEALSLIIDTIVNRAASLVAVKLASLIHKRGKGMLINKPTAIVAEGAVIENFPEFKKLLEHHLTQLLSELGTYYFDIIHVERANIIGSGVAALVNC